MMDGADDLLDLIGPDARHRRVGPHAAGVGPTIAVEDPLVVLGRRHRQRALAVAEGQQRELLALEVLLDDDALGPVAALDQQRLQRLARLRLVGGDHHALAGGQPVGLDHRRVPVDRGQRRIELGDDAMGGGGYARGGHDLLGKRLRALQPRRPRARPEARDPSIGKRVAQPRDQRRLRPRHHEVDGFVARGGHERVYVLGAYRVHARVGGDARVARRAQKLGRLRRAEQRANDGMLAPPSADDEDQHGSGLRPSPLTTKDFIRPS
jgi:hypothetical protein